MMNVAKNAGYVKPIHLVEFDRLAEAVDYDGEELQEHLACAAMLYWEKAEKVTDLSKYDRRMFARAAASRSGKDAEAMVRKAMEDVCHRAGDYRSRFLDDLGHLPLQRQRNEAPPILETAATLLGMMALGPLWFR